jgi:hypothetical protein
MDTREAEVELSITDLYQLGEALSNHPSLRQSKIAILGPKQRADKMDFFETVAVTCGANIKMFTDFEQAITWLIMREKKS